MIHYTIRQRFWIAENGSVKDVWRPVSQDPGITIPIVVSNSTLFFKENEVELERNSVKVFG